MYIIFVLFMIICLKANVCARSYALLFFTLHAVRVSGFMLQSVVIKVMICMTIFFVVAAAAVVHCTLFLLRAPYLYWRERLAFA